MLQSRSLTPAAIAGVTRKVWMNLHELQFALWSATECAWFSTFLENAVVSRVRRRMCIRIVRFWRSKLDHYRVAGGEDGFGT
jgi:hypothetical protein